MRYLLLPVWFFLLALTWFLTPQSTLFPIDVSEGLKNELQVIIKNYIEENVPTAQDVEFHRLWSEPKNKKQVRVHFYYSFLETAENTRTSLEGFAELNRVSMIGEKSRWSLDQLKIFNSGIEFKEPLVIESTQ